MSVTLSVLEAWKRGLRSYPRTWAINQFSLPNSFQPPPRAASKYILGGIFWWFICLGRFCFIKMISHVSPQSTFRVQHAAHGKAIIKEKKVMLDPWLHFVPQNLLKSYLSCSKSLEGLPVASRQECALGHWSISATCTLSLGTCSMSMGPMGIPIPHINELHVLCRPALRTCDQFAVINAQLIKPSRRTCSSTVERSPSSAMSATTSVEELVN